MTLSDEEIYEADLQFAVNERDKAMRELLNAVIIIVTKEMLVIANEEA